MKSLFKVLKYIILTILIILAILYISVFIQTRVNPNKVPTIFGYKPFIVLSGSMESELYRGDLAIVKKIDAEKLGVDDIIAFRDENNYVVTHRIIEVTTKDGQKAFITKGDNNNTEDSGSVSLDAVEGIYIGKIGGFGNVLLVIQKPLTLGITLGIILVIGVVWIVAGNSKLSAEEKKELEELRKKTQEDNK